MRIKYWKRIIFAVFGIAAVVLCVVLSIHLAENGEDMFILKGSIQFIQDSKVISLGKLNVDAGAVTLSGFSAGGAMANQLHVAHSSLFSGAAIFSQVFYRCGPKNIIQFGIQCSSYGKQWFPYSVQNAVDDAQSYAKNGLIDDLRNLKDNRVFIWTGGADEYIPRGMAVKNRDFYEAFIRNSSQISLVVNEPAKHLLPTKSFGGACDADASQNYYLGNCNYSGAYHGLKFLLGDRINQLEVTPDLSSLTLYNQSEFYSEDIKEVAMGTVGFIYIPTACKDGAVTCLLHFNLHGCNEYPPQVAREYILNNGFLPIAEANNIIVVFPLTTKVSGNMDGCWDFYSYTDSDFATKNGKQVQVIHKILTRILHSEDERHRRELELLIV